jgi:hypothetical protein
VKNQHCFIIFTVLIFFNKLQKIKPMPYKSFIVEILKTYGISTEMFIAGVSGAVVFLTQKNKEMSNTEKFLTTLSGGLSANYLTPVVANWFNLDQSVLYGIAFLLGYSGMKSVELILSVLQNKIKKEQ